MVRNCKLCLPPWWHLKVQVPLSVPSVLEKHRRDLLTNLFTQLQCLNNIPSKATANSNLAKIYFERGEIQKAKHFYLAALYYDPLLKDAYFNLGSTYGTLGIFDSSFYYYNQCLKLDPKRTDAIIYMGLNYYNTGKPDTAIMYYDKAIQMDPYIPASYILKTKVLLLSDRWDEGEQVIDKAQSILPYNGELYY